MKKIWYAIPVSDIWSYLKDHRHILHLTDEQLYEVFGDIKRLAVEIVEESEEE